MNKLKIKETFKELYQHCLVAIFIMVIATITRFIKFRDLELNVINEVKEFGFTFLTFMIPYFLVQFVALLLMRRLFYVTYLVAFPFVARKHELDNKDLAFTIVYTVIILCVLCYHSSRGWI